MLVKEKKNQDYNINQPFKSIYTIQEALELNNFNFLQNPEGNEFQYFAEQADLAIALGTFYPSAIYELDGVMSPQHRAYLDIKNQQGF